MIETRLLQAAVAILCLVPISASLAGVIAGPAGFAEPGAYRPDLDSHVRYLSGIFLGVGLGFLSCIPGIARKTARFRLLTAFVVLGGLARLLSLVEVGAPSWPHQAGLVLELGVVPSLALWQTRLARAAES